MLPRTNAINSEEFIFYIDLIANFLKKKQLTKAISSFIKEKEKFNALTSYGVVLFQKDENPVNTYDLKDIDEVINIINDAWETRETEKSYLENGLYEILAYIFRKSREVRKDYRVIIISDTPSKLSEDYYNALYDLLIKAKKFSAFIDIIRVGDQKFYEDDVKLKVISSETHGGTFYCPDDKLLQNILGSLIQSKKEFKIIKSDESEQIFTEDKIFYEKLAVDLISLSPEEQELCDICEQELCPICETHSDEIHKCFNCDTKFHNCCAAKYSLARNIGFKHIFRCLQCETLLKLDEEFVNMIYEEELEEGIPIINEEDTISEKFTIEESQDEELVEEPEIQEEIVEIVEETIKKVPESSTSPISTKKIKVGGFFGKEITIETKYLKRSIEIEEQIPQKQIKEPISITNLRPPRKKSSSTIKFCKICGETCGVNIEICPTCGAKLD